MKIIIKESKGKIRKGEKQRDQEGKGHTFPGRRSIWKVPFLEEVSHVMRF